MSKLQLFIVGLLLVLIAGYFDYLTGYQLGSAVMYLLPIALATWYGGLVPGLLIALVSAIVWFHVNLYVRLPFANYFIPVWNTKIRLVIFLSFTYLLWKLRVSKLSKRDLLDFVVHDLKVPLATNLLGLRTLQETGSALNEQQQRIIGNAIVSGQRMEVLINSLADLNRLEYGKLNTERKKVILTEIIDAAVGQVAVWAERNGVELKKKYDEIPGEVETDPALLQRVLVNLLSNAIKVSAKGASVTAGLTAVPAKMIAISITDQGPGIPLKLQKSIFDKYTQLQAQESGIVLGSGVGLAFCKYAVSALGGKISLTSEPGKGAVFTVTLPGKK